MSAPLAWLFADEDAIEEVRALAAAPKFSGAGTGLKAQPQRLVVADDDPVYLQAFTTMLESAGYAVFAFTDPQGTRVALPRVKPDAETVRAAAQHGIADFIGKPGPRAVVLAKLRGVLPPLGTVEEERR